MLCWKRDTAAAVSAEAAADARKRRRRFLFSPAAGLTANVAAMRTHQSLERFLPIQLTSKARISHTDRDTAVQQYTTAAYTPQKIVQTEKKFHFS